MQWFVFSEEERSAPAPAFRLQSRSGQWVARDDFRQLSNLVLYFPRSLDCEPCDLALKGLIAHLADYRVESTQVLAILPAPVEALATGRMDRYGDLWLLADPERRVASMYAAMIDEEPQGRDLLFVLDRFGAPIVALAEGQVEDPAIHDEILRWLTYSEIRCPE